MRKRIVGTVIASAVVVVGTGGIVAAANLAGHSGSSSNSAVQAVGANQWTASATPSATATGTPATNTPATKAATPPSTKAPTKASTASSITYVVKPGDNLSVISAWFHLHGFGALYDANRSVIGADPDLIHPGQRITISGGHLTTSN